MIYAGVILAAVVLAVLIVNYFMLGNYLKNNLNLFFEIDPAEVQRGHKVRVIVRANPTQEFTLSSLNGYLIAKKFEGYKGTWRDRSDMPLISTGEILTRIKFSFGNNIVMKPGEENKRIGVISIPKDAPPTEFRGVIQIRWIVNVCARTAFYVPPVVTQEELFVVRPRALDKGRILVEDARDEEDEPMTPGAMPQMGSIEEETQQRDHTGARPPAFSHQPVFNAPELDGSPVFGDPNMMESIGSGNVPEMPGIPALGSVEEEMPRQKGIDIPAGFSQMPGIGEPPQRPDTPSGPPKKKIGAGGFDFFSKAKTAPPQKEPPKVAPVVPSAPHGQPNPAVVSKYREPFDPGKKLRESSLRAVEAWKQGDEMPEVKDPAVASASPAKPQSDGDGWISGVAGEAVGIDYFGGYSDEPTDTSSGPKFHAPPADVSKHHFAPRKKKEVEIPAVPAQEKPQDAEPQVPSGVSGSAAGGDSEGWISGVAGESVTVDYFGSYGSEQTESTGPKFHEAGEYASRHFISKRPKADKPDKPIRAFGLKKKDIKKIQETAKTAGDIVPADENAAQSQEQPEPPKTKSFGKKTMKTPGDEEKGSTGRLGLKKKSAGKSDKFSKFD